MNNREMIFQHFAKKWGLAEPTVSTIFLIVKNTGEKYGKSSRILSGMGVKLSARQVRYFYKRVRLDEILRGKTPANLSELIRKL